MSWPFAPFQRLARRIARPTGKRSGIEAGAPGRRWTGASTVTDPRNSTLVARGPAAARATAAVLNSPQGARIEEAWASALVGKGWQARSRHPDADTARTLSAAFELVVAQHLVTLARAVVRDGEAFARLRIGPDDRMRLQLIPAEQVDPTLTRDLGNGARIVSGIEFDADGEVVAYHVLPEAPGTPFTAYLAAVRVPARDMLHVFDPLFPGQVRGLSWLAPVLLKMRDRDGASDALLMQLKTASLLTGFIRDPDGTFAGFEGEAQGNALNVALEPGAMRILPQGADVTFSTPGSGLAQAVEFMRAQDREIAAGAGLTYEQLTGDLSEANYSSARVGLLEFRRRAEMLQKTLIEGQFLAPLWRRWIEVEALAGRIEATGAARDDFMAVRFVAPGWQWVDPAKEVAADVAAIEAGLKSREEVVAGRGRDIDELDAERARDAGGEAA
ncbi:phage portal protein [Histidinibacterium lentulum]|uniref:Phage portal protein n=1 Tax=Histidinibacterium lentulum TaxID=2480588 RepID=A0A3N2QV97_9RHOB|nr:phage portal protein [Histidinibacterium lentulum]ROT99077.1 phage portal protein [Histidinibacterium lentulum]